MIRIGDLRPPKGSVKIRRRVGRGEGSGMGKTSGRGNKGANSRAGTRHYAWFEGGQMPLSRRLPKKGFSNYPFTFRYQTVNLRNLSRFEANAEVTPEALRKSRLVRRPGHIKLLGDGDIRVPLIVKLHAISKIAKEKITAAGGKFEEIA